MNKKFWTGFLFLPCILGITFTVSLVIIKYDIMNWFFGILFFIMCFLFGKIFETSNRDDDV